MDPRLVKAAATGNVEYLCSLMKEDMLLLDTVVLVGAETPLHIASMRGHLSFVQEMVKLKREFAYELNQDGFTPLHLASACGHVQVVHELLKLDQNLCTIQGKEGRLALHCAAVKGRIDVMKALLSTSPPTVETKTARGDTPLHIAVKNNQFHALKLLVEHVKEFKKEGVLNDKDNQGNTVLHLAASRKQYEVVHLLLVDDEKTKEVMLVNSLNRRGMSPLDVLMLMESEGGDLEIHTILQRAGAKRGNDTSNNMAPLEVEIIGDNQVDPATNTHSSEQSDLRSWPRMEEINKLFGYKPNRNSVKEARNILLTVAALMTTATYQAVLSPPGGLWQDDINGHAGKSIMGTKSEGTFWLFLLGNSVGFYTSLHMITWLTIGFPLQYPLTLLLFFISFNYSGSIVSLVPTGNRSLAAAYLAIAFGLFAPFIPSAIRRIRYFCRCLFR